MQKEYIGHFPFQQCKLPEKLKKIHWLNLQYILSLSLVPTDNFCHFWERSVYVNPRLSTTGHQSCSKTDESTCKHAIAKSQITTRTYNNVPWRDTNLLRKRQTETANYYNHGIRKFPELSESDIIHMKPFHLGDKEWRKATISGRLDKRSYMHGRNPKRTHIPLQQGTS